MNIRFPLLRKLRVNNFGLFPGNEDGQGLTIDFSESLTMILGTNGLGKTTMIRLVYYMLTGPYKPKANTQSVEGLGSGSYEAIKMKKNELRGLFANRVSDGAERATATLDFQIGKTVFTLERRLATLDIKKFAVNGRATLDNNHNDYERLIRDEVGVVNFGDWLILLNYFMFSFEDRRALVWDTNAQREVFRILYLPAEKSQKWLTDFRAIMELDSEMRNLRYAVGKEREKIAEIDQKSDSKGSIQKTIEELEMLQAELETRKEDIETALSISNQARIEMRDRVNAFEQSRESKLREYEYEKFRIIDAAFPSESDTLKFIFSRILTEGSCSVCGSEVPNFVALVQERVESNCCLICGSKLTTVEKIDGSNINIRLFEELKKVDQDLANAEKELNDVSSEYQDVLGELNQINREIVDNSRALERLAQSLPPEEGEIFSKKSQLSAMEATVENLKVELSRGRKHFRDWVDLQVREMTLQNEKIRSEFQIYAEGFLVEEIRLTWSPQPSTIGEGGLKVNFPAFRLEMTGTDFSSPVRRTQGDQVSESQREFIDLAFRMALIKKATLDGAGCIVIDAPEASLDIVFSERAANILSTFAQSGVGSQLLITSNLVDGDLIPNILEATQDCEVVNLFDYAVETAAVRENKPAYQEAFNKLTGKQHRA